MTILKVLGRDNVVFDTESNRLFDIENEGCSEALMYCSPKALEELSERLGHPIVKVCWAFNTYHKEWKPSSAFDTNKAGDVEIYSGCYEGVVIEIITEGPLWNSKPNASLLAELEAKAYEREAQLNKEQEFKAQLENHDLLSELLNPGNSNVKILSFEKYKEDVHRAEMVLKIGDYKVSIEPITCLGYSDFKITIKENYVS
jgi:hypothetical protein